MNAKDLQMLVAAAHMEQPVAGLTHDFYAYPARFSPFFVSTVVKLFSRPGDLVLDPFMGGGTTVVEALVAGRRAVGVDVNSLAIFLAKVKTSILQPRESEAITSWVEDILPRLHYYSAIKRISPLVADPRTRNLGLSRSRAIKKILAIALDRLSSLPTEKSQDFVRCVLLRTAQWALDNRKRTTSLGEFREKLRLNAAAMLVGIDELGKTLRPGSLSPSDCRILQTDASELATHRLFKLEGNKVDLVVCSPPYPGVHILYHRWQVDGRRETPAPYWIADCFDGQGGAFYTFGDRRATGLNRYFDTLRASFQSIHGILKPGGYLVQMVSFNNRRRYLQRYLDAMTVCGFAEVESGLARRIWRTVPNRKWHATLKGETGAARELVLIHRATK